MSKNFEIKTKKALFLNGKQITDYDWDHFNIDNIHEVIVATDEDKYFALFDLDGDILFELESHIDYEIMPTCILIKVMHIDLPLYGLVSFNGKILLPFGFTSIKKTHNDNILKIKISDLICGYYILSTNQIILNAEQIQCISKNEYNFFMEDGWNKYVLINGKYEHVD